MYKGLIASAAIAGSIVVASAPAQAQEDEDYGSLRQRLRIEQEFGSGDNLGLEVPSEGQTSLATTRLSYGLESKTRLQELSLAVGGALRFGDVAAGNNIKTGFVDPLIGLRYLRDTGNAALSVDADYRQTDISLTAPLWTFLDQDGIIRPPSDFSNIRGSGERHAYRINAELETGKQAPFGLRFLAGADGTDYIDATDPGLSDYDNTDLGLSALFRFNQVTTGFVDLRYSTYSNQNATETERETQTFEAGFDREISARSSLNFRAGYTDVDTTETDIGTNLRGTRKRSGPSGRLGYALEMPNGDFRSDFDLTQNSSGQRGTLRVTRSLTLPRGSLSANIGLTSFDSSDPRVIGGLYWTHELPSSRFNLRLTRDVFVDSNDEDQFSNFLIAGYTHDINSVSSVSADLSLSYNEATSTNGASRRGTALLVYNHTLTRDWSMNAGVEFKVLDEDVSGRAESSALFFGIGRNFDF